MSHRVRARGRVTSREATAIAFSSSAHILLRHPRPILFAHMPPFEVPGWSVPEAPTPDSNGAKKRKRPPSDGDTNKLETAHINFDKLMKKLAEGNTAPAGGKKQKRERKSPNGDPSARGSVKPTRLATNGGTPQGKKRKQAMVPAKGHGESEPAERAVESEQVNVPRRKKTDTQQRSRAPTHESDAADSSKPPIQKLTKLQASLKSSLDGARFRCESRNTYSSIIIFIPLSVGSMRSCTSLTVSMHTGSCARIQPSLKR